MSGQSKTLLPPRTMSVGVVPGGQTGVGQRPRLRRGVYTEATGAVAKESPSRQEQAPERTEARVVTHAVKPLRPGRAAEGVHQEIPAPASSLTPPPVGVVMASFTAQVPVQEVVPPVSEEVEIVEATVIPEPPVYQYPKVGSQALDRFSFTDEMNLNSVITTARTQSVRVSDYLDTTPSVYTSDSLAIDPVVSGTYEPVSAREVSTATGIVSLDPEVQRTGMINRQRVAKAHESGKVPKLMTTIPSKERRLDPVAIISLIVSIAGFGPLSLIAVILAHTSMHRIRYGRFKGMRMANAAMVIGYVGLILLLIAIIVLGLVMNSGEEVIIAPGENWYFETPTIEISPA